MKPRTRRGWAACSARSAADRALALAAVGWLLLAGLPAAAQSLPPAAEAVWVEVRSPHFVVLAQKSPRAARDAALHAEQLRWAIGRLTSFDVTISRPVLVHLFRSSDAMTSYVHRVDGRPASVSGSYAGRPEADFLIVDGSVRRDHQVLSHEFAHLFLGRTHGHLPLWLEEGLAEFYQTFRLDGADAVLGEPIRGHLRTLRSEPLLAMRDLLAVDHASPLYNEADRRSVFYAQAWALVHYLLMDAPHRAGQLDRFVESLDGGMDPATAFEQAFGADPDGLVPELLEYVRRPSHRWVRSEVAPPPRPSLAERQLSRAETLTRLGELLLADRDRPVSEAEHHFHAALAADPSWGRAHSGLGVVAEREGRWDEARTRHKDAARLSPDDPLIAFRLGMAIAATRPGADEAVAALERAVALDPTFASAWSGLADHALIAGRLERGLEAGRRATRLEPFNPNSALALVDALLATSHRDEALRVMRRPALAADPARTSAWQLLARHDLREVQAAIEGGDPDRADVLLDRFETSVLPELEDGEAAQEMADLGSRITAARFANRLAAAAEARIEGDEAAAQAIAEAVAQEAGPGEWADRARAFIARASLPTPTPRIVVTVAAAEMAELNRLIEAGLFDHALRLLHDLDGRISNDRDDWVDAKIRELERARAHNQFVTAYNRAVDLYNGGRAPAACQAVSKLLAGDLLPEDRRTAEAFMTDCP